MEKKALIVDDDAKLRSLLATYLEEYGFKTLTLADGSRVIKTLSIKFPDIVILDIMLGNENGLDILKEIRKKSSIPVIMLTAKGEDTDRIIGLEIGADDYLAKPFNPRELLARINSVLRRSNATKKSKPETDSSRQSSSGELILNTAKRMFLINKTEISLSLTEYRIIHTLIKNPNTVYSRDDLMNIARGKDFMAIDRSIDVHISNLRAKIDAISPGLKNRIKTVWGTGYMLEED